MKRPDLSLLGFALVLGGLIGCASPSEENDQQMIDDERTLLVTSEVDSDEVDTTYQANGIGERPVVGTVGSYDGDTDGSPISMATNRAKGGNQFAEKEADDVKRTFEGESPASVDDEYKNLTSRDAATRTTETPAGYPNRPLSTEPSNVNIGSSTQRDPQPFKYQPRTTRDDLYSDQSFSYSNPQMQRTYQQAQRMQGIQLESAPEIDGLAGNAMVPKVVGYQNDMVPNAAADEAVSRSIYSDRAANGIDMEARARNSGPIKYVNNALFWAYSTNSPTTNGEYSSVIWAGGKTYNTPQTNLTNAEMVDGDDYTPLPVPADEQ